MILLDAGALAALERRAGDLPLALKYLDQALAVSPNHLTSLQEKALVLTALVGLCKRQLLRLLSTVLCASVSYSIVPCCAVLCCAVLCCAVLCCAAAVLCCQIAAPQLVCAG